MLKFQDASGKLRPAVRESRSMRLLKVVFVWTLLASACYAVVVHETITYKSSVQKISGRVTGFGTVNPGVAVRVLDKPEVWSDDSLTFDEKRARQSTIASTTTNPKGEFTVHKIPNGSYEVEFSGREGWNPLSVFVTVDATGPSAKLCVEMSIEGGGQGPSVRPCGRQPTQ